MELSVVMQQTVQVPTPPHKALTSSPKIPATKPLWWRSSHQGSPFSWKTWHLTWNALPVTQQTPLGSMSQSFYPPTGMEWALFGNCPSNLLVMTRPTYSNGSDTKIEKQAHQSHLALWHKWDSVAVPCSQCQHLPIPKHQHSTGLANRTHVACHSLTLDPPQAFSSTLRTTFALRVQGSSGPTTTGCKYDDPARSRWKTS